MDKTKRKTIALAVSGVMMLSSITAIASVNNINTVYAAESTALQNAKAKIGHLTSSIKKNFLGIKNQATWQLYIGEARELIKKIPSSEKAQRDALTIEVNKDEAFVNGLARINHVEKSIQPKNEGGYGNYLGIKNAETWNGYLKLAKDELEKVDKTIFKKQYDELIDRMNAVSKIVTGIEEEFQVEYNNVLKIYEEAKLSKNVDKIMAALKEAEKLGTCSRSDKLESDIKALLEGGNSEAPGPSENTDLNIKGKVTKDKDFDIYEFNLAKPGKVSFEVISNISSVHFNVLSGDKTSKLIRDYIGASETEPEKYVKEGYFEKGTYYVKIENHGYEGEYSLKTKFTPSSNSEKEPNNTLKDAQVIKTGESVDGLLSYTDKTDMYKIKLEEAGRLNLNILYKMGTISFYLLDEEGADTIISRNYMSGSDRTEANKWNDYVDLEAGIYYLKVNYAGDTGEYTLKNSFVPANNNEKEPNNSMESAQLLSNSSNNINGFLSYNDTLDYYKIVLASEGTLNIDLLYQMESVDFYLLDKDGLEVDEGRGYTKYPTSGDVSTWSKSIKLKAGTYYLKFGAYRYSYDNTGKYTLNCSVN